MKQWTDWSRQDNACDLFVPSDIRVMLGEIERLRLALGISASRTADLLPPYRIMPAEKMVQIAREAIERRPAVPAAFPSALRTEETNG